MLVQPEHILSFKLMAVEAGLSGQACAQSLLDTQMFLDQMARDIVDESDENFSIKFKLIYTMGSQRLIESLLNDGTLSKPSWIWYHLSQLE
jgi:hypothetical protein